MEDEGIAVVSWEIGGERDESGDWREREREKRKKWRRTPSYTRMLLFNSLHGKSVRSATKL